MDITKVLKNSLREKKKIARHVQASGNYFCYLSNISSFYLMFCLEPPQGVGPPKAKVLRLIFWRNLKTYQCLEEVGLEFT